MRSFVTGAGGFVASHLIEYLLSKNESVYGSVRWNEDLSSTVGFKDKIQMIPMDLNDLTSCIKAIRESKPDYVFHLGAESFVPDSYIYPETYFRANTIGTYNLLEAIRIVGLDPIIHICSSSEVYGLVTKDLIPIKETCPLNPSNPYAVSKVGADMMALMYWTNYGLKTIRTRMFTHSGYGRKMQSAEVSFARQIALVEKGLREPVLYHGNLNSVRTWADVKDAVRAYYLLVRKCEYGEVYNIGGDATKTIGEMLDYMLSLSKVKIEKRLDESLLRPYDVDLQIPDCSKFKNQTGWKPEIPFETTIQDVLNYWRERVWDALE